MKQPGCTLLAVLILGLAGGVAQAGVETTRHNLSVSGPGPVKATAESRICVFCHTPHNASPSGPLWNRHDAGGTYIPYTSTTVAAAPGQPTGASILCLSCHDGTIALGDVLSAPSPITMAGGVTTMPAGPGRLGTDLSDDHPVSFDYATAAAQSGGQLVPASILTGPVKLDPWGRLQCTACHDPHNNPFGKFLVMSDRGGALCETCHVKNYWSQSSHHLSTATWNGVLPDPWPSTSWTTVADNACRSCHRPHSAGGAQRLLNYAAEEDNCTACHNGHVAAKDVMAEFDKFSRHPITDTTGVHDPAEPAVVSARHVECVDCHNPHAARPGTGNPPGPLTGGRGVGTAGGEIKPLTAEYQLCFRCHADSPNQPPPRTARQFPETNVRLEFNTSNPSYHPVTAAGKNPSVPSLIPPLNVGSMIKCTDCHNSDDGPNAGGVGANGPHGSVYEPLLERQYLTQDPTAESASAYAMCYKCHDRNSILGNQSFSRHSLHIRGEGGMGGMGGGGLSTPCNVCHDPHASQQPKLINFDTSVVSPSSSGRLEYFSTGTFSGGCYLRCHGENHNPKTYPGGGM